MTVIAVSSDFRVQARPDLRALLLPLELMRMLGDPLKILSQPQMKVNNSPLTLPISIL